MGANHYVTNEIGCSVSHGARIVQSVRNYTQVFALFTNQLQLHIIRILSGVVKSILVNNYQ